MVGNNCYRPEANICMIIDRNTYKLNTTEKLPESDKSKQNGIFDYFSCHKGTSASKPVNLTLLRTNIEEKLAKCCTEPVVLSCRDYICREELRQKKPIYITTTKCGNRICSKIPCLNARIAKAIRKYTAMYEKMRYPRFITLTYAGYHDLNYDIRRELGRAWKLLSQYLRRRGLLKSYIMALELVEKECCIGKEYVRLGFYYHLHVIYDGKYIPFPDLQNKWKSYTKTSHRVRIEPIRRGKKIRGYITKYISKGSQLFANIDEFIKIRKMQFFSSYCPKYCPKCNKRLNLRTDLISKNKYICSHCKHEFMEEFLVLPRFEGIVCPYCTMTLKYDFNETEDLIEKGIP